MSDRYKEAFEKFYPHLVKSLPMTDPYFYVELEKKNLFFGDLLKELKAKDTGEQKAAHFLQNVVDHSLKINNIKPFASLLEVMENSDNKGCKSLAKEITMYLHKRQSPGPQPTATTHPNTAG